MVRHAVLVVLVLAACSPSTTGDGGVANSDGGVVPGECPKNWAGPFEQAIDPRLVHVTGGELVLEASSSGVTVETPLGAIDGPMGIRRFEFSRLVLGAGGRFTMVMPWVIKGARSIDIVTLEVTDTSARLVMAPQLNGLTYSLPFSSPPNRATIVVESLREGFRVRASFFEAAGDQVLTGGLLDFNGELLTQLKLVGLSSRAKLSSYSLFTPNDGHQRADDFDCDTVGLPLAPGWAVDRYAELGSACSSDAACGASDRCSDGRCRRPCFNSTVCDREVCLAHPSGGGFCRLTDEHSCGDAGVCPTGLVCGVDGTCRRPCTGGRDAGSSDFAGLAGTCPLHYVSTDFGGTPTELNLFRCVAGACADDAEFGAQAAGGWGCGYGTRRCTNDGTHLMQCNTNGPGFQNVEVCGRFSDSCAYVCPDDAGVEYACPTGTVSLTPKCHACPLICDRQEDVINGCLPMGSSPAIDCETGFSWCSHGPGGDLARRQPGQLATLDAYCEPVVAPQSGGLRVTVSAPDGGTLRIDRTEVSRAQYVGFLQTRPSVSSQPAVCSANTSLLPGVVNYMDAWPWFDHPDWPALVDWCDAVAYCRYQGGHLCRAFDGGALAPADVEDPTRSEWAWVATSGGTQRYSYGPVRDPAACWLGVGPQPDVGTTPTCTSAVPGFTGVFDLSGSAAEWVDGCAATTATPGTDRCPRLYGDGHDTWERGQVGAAIRCCY